MAQQVCVVLSTAEREQLAAIGADRNRLHCPRVSPVGPGLVRNPLETTRRIGEKM
jgi:hypothetical protein